MKKFLSLKQVLLGLGCIGTLNGFAFSPLAPLPTALGNLPLYFQASPEPAVGQPQFITRGANYQFLLSPAKVQIALGKSGMDPAEVSFAFDKPALFRDVETGRELYVDPSAAQKGYRHLLDGHLAQTQAVCQNLGIDYHLFATDRPFDEALLEFLQHRLS